VSVLRLPALPAAVARIALVRADDGRTPVLGFEGPEWATAYEQLDLTHVQRVTLTPTAAIALAGGGATAYLVTVGAPGGRKFRKCVQLADQDADQDLVDLVGAAGIEGSDLVVTLMADLRDAAAAAADHASAAALDAVGTAEDRVQTGADRTQTGRDAAATAEDRVQTGADRTQTGRDAAATAEDRVQTGADRTQTGRDAAATAEDLVQTGADRTQTGLDAAATAEDRVQTGADRTQTGLDAAATAEDRVQTGADRTQTGLDAATTAEDRVQTGADRTQTGLDAVATADHLTDLQALYGAWTDHGDIASAVIVALDNGTHLVHLTGYAALSITAGAPGIGARVLVTRSAAAAYDLSCPGAWKWTGYPTTVAPGATETVELLIFPLDAAGAIVAAVRVVP
jgi:hypothetical protein